MLSTELIIRLISERKCLRSTEHLGSAEHLISRHSFPALFRGETQQQEVDFVKLIFGRLESVLANLDDDGRASVQFFMQDVLRNGKIHNEEFLHRYLFEFWDDAWLNQEESFGLLEKFYKCQLDEYASPFAKSVIPKLYKRGEHVPDIIAISGDATKRVFVIEIKNEPLDDRALGQILRYYQVVRHACDRNTLYGSAKRVVPVLVVPEGDLSFWDSVPFHFREVLEILYWRLSSDGRVELVDGKAVLRRISGGRIFATI
jgi:hypothetical protein